ncbi:hypothetical protein Ndes2526B_g04928 [Nannochloris sp. 'desiccata']
MQRVSCSRLSRSEIVTFKCQASSAKKVTVASPVKASNSLIRLPWQIETGIIGTGSFASVAPAWAEDAFTSAIPAATDVAGPAPDDPVITVMFSLAVVALSVVTLGVAYLSLSSWNDSRQENEDRLRTSGKRPGSKKATAVKTAGSSSEDDEPKRKKAGAAATPKGFGRK